MSAYKATILVVEDNALIRTLLSDVLIERGYKVRSAEDGFSALVEIENEIPDIILSDLHMPGMSGFELLAVVSRRFPTIRAIAMSGAFTADQVPPEVIASAFYQKGTALRSLLHLVDAFTPSQVFLCK